MIERKINLIVWEVGVGIVIGRVQLIIDLDPLIFGGTILKPKTLVSEYFVPEYIFVRYNGFRMLNEFEMGH